MLDTEFHISKEYKASLVSIVAPTFKFHQNEKETIRSLDELRELLRTLGMESGNQYVQNRKAIDPATILGSGKIQEIADSAKEEGSSLLVFDFELTASQIRNIKKLTGLSVIDRAHVILEIFAEHARTKEAKIQIEISRLNYILPRLAGFWTHLGRQKGGIGVKVAKVKCRLSLIEGLSEEELSFTKRNSKKL